MIKALIVEDEKNSQELLKELITEYCEGVEVVAIAGNVADALSAIQSHDPNLLFLDIELPDSKLSRIVAYNVGRTPVAPEYKPIHVIGKT